MSAQQEDRDADLRARELFHYFQPDNPALMPPVGQRTNRSCENSTIQKTSPNLVLTALAQLAALKLGVQRAVIRYDSICRHTLEEIKTSLNNHSTSLRSPQWNIRYTFRILQSLEPSSR